MPVIAPNPKIPAAPSSNQILPPFPSMEFVDARTGMLTSPALQFLQQLYTAIIALQSIEPPPEYFIANLKIGEVNTPANNGDLTVEATSDTQLIFRFRGSDGIERQNIMTFI